MMLNRYIDILHIYWVRYVDILPTESQKTYIHPTLQGRVQGIFQQWFKYLKTLIKDILQKRNHTAQAIQLKEKTWWFVNTKNQFDTLLPIYESLSYSTEEHQWVSRTFTDKQYHFIHLNGWMRFIYWLSFFKIWYLFYKKDKDFTVRYIERIFEASGKYSYYFSLLKKYQPKRIVLATDHSMDSRALRLASKELGIKTVYLQHASVSKYFPPLSFDLNLLYGQDSLDKYKAIGKIEGKVELVGNPKLSNHKGIVSKDNIKHIGIALSLADDFNAAEELVRVLLRTFPQQTFTIRLHPRETRAFLLDNFQVIYSDSKTESVEAFLNKQEILIAGESNIHLEATILDVYSICFPFTTEVAMEDYYGFIRHGMIDAANSDEQLIELIQSFIYQPKSVKSRANYFDATLGTSNEGKSVILAAKYIKNL